MVEEHQPYRVTVGPEVQLPSGLIVMCTELTGEDQEDLTYQRTMDQYARSLNRVMARRVSVAGKTVEPSWVENLLSGDRVAILYHLRRLSLGDDWRFECKCPNANCSRYKKKFPAFASFDDESVKISPYPHGELRRIEVSVFDKGIVRKIEISLLTGVEERQVVKANQNVGLTTMLQVRRPVEVIEREDGESERKGLDLKRESLGFLQSLVSTVSENEPDITDVYVSVNCPECDTEILIDPLGDPSFLFPASSGRTST